MSNHTPNIGSIYLSPHFDDTAFSLGAHVEASPGGTMVNLFTRSAYVAGTQSRGIPSQAEVERISALRNAEDAAFASRFGLSRIHLGAEEPSLRGRASRDRAGVDDDVGQIRDRLGGLLRELISDGRPWRIFCPAGIGGHVNHLATRTVVIDMLDGLPRHVAVSFYEDLPYATRADVRWQGIKDLRAALGRRRLRRQWWPATERKLAQINIYASQHHRPVTKLSRFSPRAWWPWHPHEAVWNVLD